MPGQIKNIDSDKKIDRENVEPYKGIALTSSFPLCRLTPTYSFHTYENAFPS